MRKKTTCPDCGKQISLSNVKNHVGSKNCKGEYRPSPYSWEDWCIGENQYRLPCGFVGNKRQCTNVLNAKFFKKAGKRRKRKPTGWSWNQGQTKETNAIIARTSERLRVISLEKVARGEKIGWARSDYWTEERRKNWSERKRLYYKEHPEAHPNRKCANNRNRMSYPELVAFEKLQMLGVEFEHQKRIDEFYVDFCVGSLIIEIDGLHWHSTPDQIERDKRRDIVLKSFGFNVERIRSDERIEDRIEEIIRAWVIG